MAGKTKKKILVIEDEVSMAKALSLKLSFAGFEVETSANGKLAKETLENQNFDLILSDLVMPEFDGFQVLEYIKTKGLKTPVIILSNLAQEEDKGRAISLGAKDFFVKSDTPIANIVETVKNSLK